MNPSVSSYGWRVKLGVKRPLLRKDDQRNVWITWYIPWALLPSDVFHEKSKNLVKSINAGTDFILIHSLYIFLNFFETLKIFLINMVTILMMSAKMSTLDLLERKIFWVKDYDVIMSVHEVTSKRLLCEATYILDVVI